MKNESQKIMNALSKVQNSKLQRIGLPLTPAVINHVYESVGFEITISYGGGMGGSCQKFDTFDDITDEMLSKEFFSIRCLDGKTVTIFTKFIVKVIPIKIVVTVGEHSNEHFLYQGRNFVCSYKFYENEKYVIVRDEHSSSFKEEYSRQFYN
jgi:hypothetical protein